MKTIIIMSIILLLSSSLFSTTWIINQDGTGHFTNISAGITSTVNGDNLLVYPGIYYERINYQGKNITITSLYDGDQYDESYITNTKIDGNHEGTVVIFHNNETRDAVLNGFIIRHGKGEFHHSPGYTMGGGIFIRNSSPVISNCIIEKNHSHGGAGIQLYQSGNPLLMENTVRYNHALKNGGGINAYGQSALTNLEFCTVFLNSVYMNHGSYGSDFYLGGNSQSLIVIDTFTVQYPAM